MCCQTGPVFSYKLRKIVGFWLVEMAISTNRKPTIFINLYENTGPVFYAYNLTTGSQRNWWYDGKPKSHRRVFNNYETFLIIVKMIYVFRSLAYHVLIYEKESDNCTVSYSLLMRTLIVFSSLSDRRKELPIEVTANHCIYILSSPCS